MTGFEYSLDRRGLAASILTAVLVLVSGCAAPVGSTGALSYRGFVVDMSAGRGDPNFASIENSVKHQIDIVADCHAKPDIMEAFRATPIALAHGLKNEPGRFAQGHGVDIEAEVMPPQQPILLHELLHAYHFNKLPGGDRNPDVVTFYERASVGHFYPPTEIHDGRAVSTYLLTNPEEFFAVTASVYLWGHVDREPHDAARLKTIQPIYYAWLGQLFGTDGAPPPITH